MIVHITVHFLLAQVPCLLLLELLKDLQLHAAVDDTGQAT